MSGQEITTTAHFWVHFWAIVLECDISVSMSGKHVNFLMEFETIVEKYLKKFLIIVLIPKARNLTRSVSRLGKLIILTCPKFFMRWSGRFCVCLCMLQDVDIICCQFLLQLVIDPIKLSTCYNCCTIFEWVWVLLPVVWKGRSEQQLMIVHCIPSETPGVMRSCSRNVNHIAIHIIWELLSLIL